MCFTTAAELAAKCHKAALEGRWSSIMRFFAGLRLLVIDELGYLPLPGDRASALFQVINRRYLKSSTILTTRVEKRIRSGEPVPGGAEASQIPAETWMLHERTMLIELEKVAKEMATFPL
nr:ATP-binding protein [Streptomyces katrae]